MTMASNEDLVELVTSNRDPTREEVAELMRRYLRGAVDDAIVDRLYGQFHALPADEDRCRSESRAFRANGRRYREEAMHQTRVARLLSWTRPADARRLEARHANSR